MGGKVLKEPLLLFHLLIIIILYTFYLKLELKLYAINQVKFVSWWKDRKKDESPLTTAIRETCEEIGICEDKVKIISPLDIFISPYNTLIHPYLIFIEDISNIKINVDEVEEVFLVPLDFLLNTNVSTFVNKVNITPDANFPYELIPKKHEYKFSTGSYEIPFYIYNDHVILWGITAKILLNFLSYLKQRNYHS